MWKFENLEMSQSENAHAVSCLRGNYFYIQNSLFLVRYLEDAEV